MCWRQIGELVDELVREWSGEQPGPGWALQTVRRPTRCPSDRLRVWETGKEAPTGLDSQPGQG